ncbi:MAG: sensor histidine kinase [Proteobacteria bacterium]|nr:sensor histidine kinase [Pseudomonadota bacterium]MBU1736728.1 sensor histidine kinase [Pseudomonadota bacterium]
MVKSSLARRIFRCMLLGGLVPLLSMAFASQYFGKQAIVDSEEGHLGYAMTSRMIWLKEWLHYTKKEFTYAANISCPKKHESYSGHNPFRALHRAVDSLGAGHARYQLLAAYRDDWALEILSVAPPGDSSPSPPPDLKEALSNGEDFVFSSNYTIEDGKVLMPIGKTVLDKNGETFAFIIAKLDITNSIGRILGNTGDLGKSGKLYIVSNEGRYLSSNFGMGSIQGQVGKFPPGFLSDSTGAIHEYQDWRGNTVVGISSLIDESGWVLIAEVDKSEAYHWLYVGISFTIATSLITLLLIFIISSRSANLLAKPMHDLARVARRISEGKFGERMPALPDKESQLLGAAFNQMLDRLALSRKALAHSASMAAVGELSFGIVHEMSNPLTSVKINLQSLARKVADDPTYSEMAKIASQQTARLENMLSDLMNYGRPIQLNPEEIQFKDLAEETVRLLKKEAGSKGIFLHIDDLLDHHSFFGDREYLNRALVNLVSNAIHWSEPECTVTLTGRLLEDDDERFVMSVTDCGPGIKEAQFDRLFQPFFTTRRDGTGLGLANVRKIIEHHGGEVAAENIPGGGARFTIKLPFRGLEI